MSTFELQGKSLSQSLCVLSYLHCAMSQFQARPLIDLLFFDNRLVAYVAMQAVPTVESKYFLMEELK